MLELCHYINYVRSVSRCELFSNRFLIGRVVPRHIEWSKQQHQLVKSKKYYAENRDNQLKILRSFFGYFI
jgi:3-deoxy-D-manno-octulosonic-acid transferase